MKLNNKLSIEEYIMVKMQTTLFDSSQKLDNKKPALNSEWGTFKDSLRAPIHSWFTYPAGFSYKAVEHSIDLYKLTPGKSVIYDPFMGSGTTNIVAKIHGINSVGIEAHPFVYDITLSKMDWDINDNIIISFLESIDDLVSELPDSDRINQCNKQSFPELLLKCFLPEALYSLGLIRDAIFHNSNLGEREARFLKTALICTLRNVSIAATGWPYIAPKKIKITSMSKNAPLTFKKKAYKMLEDLRQTKQISSKIVSKHEIILGDSRNTDIKANSIDHLFTSPPYLNNFDYTDRTRLEMYFMGAAKNWGELSTKVRTKLITSATTQISRSDKRYILNEEIKKVAFETYKFLIDSQIKLSELRKIKGGKKSYDLLVTGYFNDMYEILKDNFRVLKKNCEAIYILGDSAPYGVHIPTDEIIGKLAVAVGFSSYNIQILRLRGGKWASNPQRHSVPLRETMVIVKK